MELIILGAGQYGQLTKELAESLGYSVLLLDDDNTEAVDALSAFHKYDSSFFVAIGDYSIRMHLLNKLQAAGKKIVSLISKNAYVSPSATIGINTIVEPMAVVNAGCVVGRGVLVCAGAVINHNSVISDGCHIDVNSTVPARSIIPEGAKVQAGMVWREIYAKPIKYDFDAVM